MLVKIHSWLLFISYWKKISISYFEFFFNGLLYCAVLTTVVWLSIESFVGHNHDEKLSFIQRQKLIVAYATIVSDKEIKTNRLKSSARVLT